MSIKRCCFFGHSKIYDKNYKEKLKNQIIQVIEKYNVTEFWVGNYGEFDRCAALTVNSVKQSYENVKLELVIPYLTKIINENKDYYYNTFDNLLISDIPQTTPHRYKIAQNNKYIIDKSDFMICYISNNFGGAYKSFEYAKKKHLSIYNIAGTDII